MILLSESYSSQETKIVSPMVIKLVTLVANLSFFEMGRQLMQFWLKNIGYRPLTFAIATGETNKKWVWLTENSTENQDQR